MDAKTAVEKLEDIFIEMEENILGQVSDCINNLKAGRYEEVYNVLTDLADTLTTDIVYAKATKECRTIKKN